MNNLQQTPEWYADRVGKLTASRYGDAMMKQKNGDWYASRERYKAELVIERMNNAPYPSFQTLDMRWGTDTAPQALAVYELLRDVDIVEVGFVPHPAIPMSGASPDGLVGDDGLVEIKCPASHTHLMTRVLKAPIPIEYVQQMQWQLICTGRKWCDWISFDPRINAIELQIEIRRVTLVEDAVVEIMERQARDFLDEVSRLHDQAQAERWLKQEAA